MRRTIVTAAIARRAAIGVAVAGLVLGLASIPYNVRSTASAAGNGPAIALGTATGTSVPFNATTTSTDTYRGFNLHLSTVLGGGVALTGISGSATGGTLDTAGLFCTSGTPAAGQATFGCTATGGQSTTASGLLATMTLQATGNGCVAVRLVDLIDTDPTAVVLDTYTIDKTTTTPQHNVVDGSYRNVLIGTGTLANCPVTSSVGGIAEQPDVAALPSAASSGWWNRTLYVLGGAIALVAAAGVAGWRRRRT